MITFPGVLGESAEFVLRKSKTGYDCLLNGVPVPAVISHKLVIGDGVPKVILEIAVRSYQGITRMLGED